MHEHKVTMSAKYRAKGGEIRRVEGQGEGLVAVLLLEDGSAEYKALGKVNELLVMSAAFDVLRQRYERMEGEERDFLREQLLQAMEDRVSDMTLWMLGERGIDTTGTGPLDDEAPDPQDAPGGEAEEMPADPAGDWDQL